MRNALFLLVPAPKKIAVDLKKGFCKLHFCDVDDCDLAVRGLSKLQKVEKTFF